MALMRVEAAMTPLPPGLTPMEHPKALPGLQTHRATRAAQGDTGRTGTFAPGRKDLRYLRPGCALRWTGGISTDGATDAPANP